MLDRFFFIIIVLVIVGWLILFIKKKVFFKDRPHLSFSSFVREDIGIGKTLDEVEKRNHVSLVGWLILFIKWLFYTKERPNITIPFFLIEKMNLEKDMSQASLAGDWRKKQVINLKLLWLKTIEMVENRHDFGKEEESKKHHYWMRRPEIDINFPKKWQLDDLYHFPFSQEIIADYGKVIAESDYKLYKPESILPYPKDIIKKAILFSFDYLNYDKPLYKFAISDKQKVADYLDLARLMLLEDIVDTTEKTLPKNGIENFTTGKQLREEQPYKEEEDLNLIDWRSEIDWIVKGIQYSGKEQYEYALACFDKAKKQNPDSKDLKVALGLTYFTMSEQFFDKGDRTLALDYMKKAADMECEDAIKWFKANKI